jgi:hypothetical protein
MIDGIKSFVTGLSGSGRVLSAEAVHEFTERIVNPRPVKKEAAGIPTSMSRPAWEEEKTQPPPGQQVSRARAIFDASEEAKPFDPTDFDFAMMDEESALDTFPTTDTDATAAESGTPPATSGKRRLGMTPVQLMIVVALGLALIVVAGVLVYLFLSSSIPLLP